MMDPGGTYGIACGMTFVYVNCVWLFWRAKFKFCICYFTRADPRERRLYDDWRASLYQENRWTLEAMFLLFCCLQTDFLILETFRSFTGWRKISFFFNLSFEIKDKNIEIDGNRNVQRAEFIVRAFMQYAHGFSFSPCWSTIDFPFQLLCGFSFTCFCY